MNKTQLVQHLTGVIDSFTVIDTTLDLLIDTDVTEKFDLIRLDCDPTTGDKMNDLVAWIDRQFCWEQKSQTQTQLQVKHKVQADN